MDGDIRYEITEKIAVLKSYESGWKRELNKVAWNGGDAKFDIRDWSPSHEIMSRGITFTEDEARVIYGALNEYLG